MKFPLFSKVPPALFADRFLAIRADRWQRMEAGLYLMAITGWSTAVELYGTLARAYNLPPKSASVRRVFEQYLTEYRLIESSRLNFFRTGMRILRLAPPGLEICQERGWEVKESEWDRLIRLHDGLNQPGHVALILAFAREARVRGYEVELLPDLTSKNTRSEPDIFVHRPGEAAGFYVEIENVYHKPKPNKWKNMMDLQSFVALATRTPTSRRRLVEEVKALHFPVYAVDMKMMIGAKKGPLFSDCWNAYGEQISAK